MILSCLHCRHDYHHSHNVGTYGAITPFWDHIMVSLCVCLSPSSYMRLILFNPLLIMFVHVFGLADWLFQGTDRHYQEFANKHVDPDIPNKAETWLVRPPAGE